MSKTSSTMKDRSPGFFSAAISKEQAKDSGMAAVLILLLIGLITSDDLYFKIAAGALLMNMIFALFYYPFAVIWLGISAIMGSVASKILLFIIYMIVVLPVALWRRMLGKDSLQLRAFKKGSGSVLRPRDHVYESADLEKPF